MHPLPMVLLASRPDSAPDGDVASVVPFPDWRHVVDNYWPPTHVALPDPLLFHANVTVLDAEAADYPSNRERWPLMSARMLGVIRQAGDFAHDAHEAILVDDRIRLSEEVELGQIPVNAIRKGYWVLGRVPVVDLIDWANTLSVPDRFEPASYVHIEELALRDDVRVPPAFRILGVPGYLLVSGPCSEALTGACLRGLQLHKPGDLDFMVRLAHDAQHDGPFGGDSESQ